LPALLPRGGWAVGASLKLHHLTVGYDENEVRTTLLPKKGTIFICLSSCTIYENEGASGLHELIHDDAT
jgi:hypothetical protein